MRIQGHFQASKVFDNMHYYHIDTSIYPWDIPGYSLSSKIGKNWIHIIIVYYDGPSGVHQEVGLRGFRSELRGVHVLNATLEHAFSTWHAGFRSHVAA